MQHQAQGSAVKSRNRAKLQNFKLRNQQYKNDALLNDAAWKNDVSISDIKDDQVYMAMVDQWTEQDMQLDKIFREADHKVEDAIIQMYENDYAGTGTGVTASRLAGKGARKLGQYKSEVLSGMMLAEDQAATRKDAIRTKAEGERWNLYDEIWRSPIHGPTPHAPSLEAKPSKAGLVLGLAQSALGGAVQAGVFKAPDIGGKNIGGGGLKDGLSFGDAMNTDLNLGLDYSTFTPSRGIF